MGTVQTMLMSLTQQQMLIVQRLLTLKIPMFQGTRQLLTQTTTKQPMTNTY
jgi:hypothetical protein